MRCDLITWARATLKGKKFRFWQLNTAANKVNRDLRAQKTTKNVPKHLPFTQERFCTGSNKMSTEHICQGAGAAKMQTARRPLSCETQAYSWGVCVACWGSREAAAGCYTGGASEVTDLAVAPPEGVLV